MTSIVVEETGVVNAVDGACVERVAGEKSSLVKFLSCGLFHGSDVTETLFFDLSSGKSIEVETTPGLISAITGLSLCCKIFNVV
jgi:hypothetical protein